MATRPTYRMGHKRYGIDTCEPQREAVREGKIEFHALTKGHYPGTLMPRNILPGLNSIGFWDANTSQDWGLDPHRNEGIKIVFFETGTCDLVMDQKTFNLQAGNFMVTRPWQLRPGAAALDDPRCRRQAATSGLELAEVDSHDQGRSR